MGNSASACVARLKLASTGLLEAWQWFFREQASDLIMTNDDKWWFKRYEWEYQQVGCVWKWDYWENHKMIALIGGKRWFTIKCWALSQNCQTDPHHEDAKFVFKKYWFLSWVKRIKDFDVEFSKQLHSSPSNARFSPRGCQFALSSPKFPQNHLDPWMSWDAMDVVGFWSQVSAIFSPTFSPQFLSISVQKDVLWSDVSMPNLLAMDMGCSTQ